MIRGVTFDFWNTLVRENATHWAQQSGAMAEMLQTAGIERSQSELDAGRRIVRAWFDESWLENRPVTPELGGRVLAGALGLSHRAEVVHRLGVIYRNGADPATTQLADGVADTLGGLRARGVVVGIICDAGVTPGATLRRYLDHHGVLECFSHYVFSDEVGAYKPDRVLFDAAAAGLGVDKNCALAHVGDLRRTDIAGARHAGYTAVRYRGINDDDSVGSPHDDAVGGSSAGDDADLVIDDLRHLLEVLELPPVR